MFFRLCMRLSLEIQEEVMRMSHMEANSMRSTRLVKRLSVVVATVAMAALAATQTASAAQLYVEHGGTQVQVDTRPLNGAPSWIWIYGSDSAFGGYVRFHGADGGTGKLSVGPGEAVAVNVHTTVTEINVCTVWEWNGLSTCGGWRGV
ncbi:hypothetical protein [Streptomyces fructofermentans]|uniref:hypothetical protein n=1 Tax=Streptomyces fructofermentans TaxID=152141 RepID=UPI0033EBB69C